MGKISVQLGGLAEAFGIDGAYRMIREAGFDGVDVNPMFILTGKEIRAFKRSPVLDLDADGILGYFAPFRDAAEKYGLANVQAHAPYPTCMAHDPDYSEYLLQGLEKIIGGCAAMNCRRLVIHPFFYPYDDQLSPEEEWELNMKNYTRLLPFAQRHQVTICLENMFIRRGKKIYAACCSDITLACRYIDALNERAGERRFGFCLDTGHLLLVGRDVRQDMLQLGERLEALHIHDNNGMDDQHLFPYSGILDWERFTDGLRRLSFQKPISFETHGGVAALPPELAQDALNYLAKTGRMFLHKAGIE